MKITVEVEGVVREYPLPDSCKLIERVDFDPDDSSKVVGLTFEAQFSHLLDSSSNTHPPSPSGSAV